MGQRRRKSSISISTLPSLDDPRRYPLQDYGTSQWSADGTQLAFEAAIDGDSADLFVYSSADGGVKHLTSGSAQDYALGWSPVLPGFPSVDPAFHVLPAYTMHCLGAVMELPIHILGLSPQAGLH